MFAEDIWRVVGEAMGYRDKETSMVLASVMVKNVCEGYQGPCEARTGLAWESSRTGYERVEGQPDRNRPILLCRACAAAHHEDWDYQWQEYRRSVL